MSPEDWLKILAFFLEGLDPSPKCDRIDRLPMTMVRQIGVGEYEEYQTMATICVVERPKVWI